SIADSSLRSQRLKTSRNFCILRSCSHVVRFIERLPCGGSKTGQLVCYITRTTHLLTTFCRLWLALPRPPRNTPRREWAREPDRPHACARPPPARGIGDLSPPPWREFATRLFPPATGRARRHAGLIARPQASRSPGG